MSALAVASTEGLAAAERDRKLSLCRAIGLPFTPEGIALLLDRSRRLQAVAAHQEQLNRAYQLALEAEDLEALETVLLGAERLCG
jgi:hypothetical protein